MANHDRLLLPLRLCPLDRIVSDVVDELGTELILSVDGKDGETAQLRTRKGGRNSGLVRRGQGEEVSDELYSSSRRA